MTEAFERRAARAAALATESAVAAEPLRFAAGLYREQGRLAEALEALHAERSLSGRLQDDLDRILARREPVLRYAAEQGPRLLADEARRRATDGGSRLLDYWRSEADPDYLSRALLRPYVELLARLSITPDRQRRTRCCPFCGGRPWIAARRPAPESDAAQRLLGCALCGSEWPVGRICCPSCGEEDPAKLPSFTEKTHPVVRIEACQACMRYVKSIDVTLDGRAIPEVDDLASVGMDLWAGREGFIRLEQGLAGI